jgi:hypothetical protein
MKRRSAYTPRSFVKPAHAVGRRPADRVSMIRIEPCARSPGCEESPRNLLVFLHYTMETRTEFTARSAMGAVICQGAKRCLPELSPPPPQHVAVIRHKVTTRQHVVALPTSRCGQEVIVSEPEPATPSVQTSHTGEKTFTRRGHDTLRSHLSCIAARGFPFSNGAADVSGR